MAVSVDTVYQKVLVLANKEQRGYITPQEFNLYANQAQREILEQYFYDVNQWSRQHGNDTEYSDMLSLLSEKIGIFNVRVLNLTVSSGILQIINNAAILGEVYKLGSILVNNTQVEIEEVSYSEYQRMALSALVKPSVKRPVYVNRTDGLNIYPNTIASVDMQYIRTPENPQWGFVVVKNKALFDPNPTKTTNFELHASEEQELVYKILKLAGVSMKRDDVTKAGHGMEQAAVQQEKQ